MIIWAAASILAIAQAATITHQQLPSKTGDPNDGLQDAIQIIKSHLQLSRHDAASQQQQPGIGFTAMLGELEDGGIIYDGGGSIPRGERSRGLRSRYSDCYTRLLQPYQEGWSNWFQTVETSSPVFRVKTDAELRNIVKKNGVAVSLDGKPKKTKSGKTKKTKCTIRAMGSTQSEDGMVMQRTEENVVVVSLADHTPDHPDWATPGIDEETGRVRLRAGMSWYDAVPIYRPRGFVLRERTALRSFTVAGVISNMVHGGSNSGGFVHSDVTKLLVMLSDGSVTEVEGEENLKFWRSSAGQLGIILAVEMQLVSEEDGGLSMQRSTDSYSDLLSAIPTREDIGNLVAQVSQRIYEVSATYDNNQFFFDWYGNNLFSYFMDFTGPNFSGEDPLSTQYEVAANESLIQFGGNDIAFNGGAVLPFPDDLCDFLCAPGTGNPPTGDGTIPCAPIPSPSNDQELLCNNPIEVAAALCAVTSQVTDMQYDLIAGTVNDGYSIDSVLPFSSTIIFIPSRALPQLFGTWWGATAAAITTIVDPDNPRALPFRYAPNNLLEMRFIRPNETAVMNPIPTFEDWKEEFDTKYAAHTGSAPSAFDLFFPPVTGIPDGLFSAEIISLKGINDEDVNQFFAFIEGLWRNMPSNPLAPYGPNISPELGPIVPNCDLQAIPPVTFCAENVHSYPMGVFLSPIDPAYPCCNPHVPVKTVHLGKGWGYGTDPETTPITGKPVPFTNQDAIDDLFSSPPSKASSVEDFNAKVEELNADVFAGGALLRWLRPDEAKPFEPRKLNGQECGSPEYVMNPDAECLVGICDTEEAVCEGILI